MTEEGLTLLSAKLGEKGAVTVPRPLLVKLGIADKDATLYFTLVSGRITVLTESDVADRFADLSD